MKPKPDTENHMIAAMANCRIVAEQVKEGEAAKLPRIEIEAYNGGIMIVGYYGPVVIDLAGLEAADITPIYYSHAGSYDVANVLGQTSAVKNDGKTLFASGEMMSEGDTAQEVKTLAGNGFKFQSSVGVDPLQSGAVEAGRSRSQRPDVARTVQANLKIEANRNISRTVGRGWVYLHAYSG